MRKVEDLPSGRFKVRFRHEGRQTSETFDKRSEAVQFNKWIEALGTQGALDKLYAEEQQSVAPTLNQVAAEHIAHLTGIEDGTRIGYERLWGRTWGPLVGHLPANRVTADHVKAAVNTLALRYARKSLENQRGLLAPIMERAVELGYLSKNPTKGIRLPEGKRVEVGDEDDDDPAEHTYLTHEEWEFLYLVFDEHYRPFIRFLVGTGCRWGEAVVLRRRDVDLEQRIIRIRRALKWSPDGKRVIGPPKTKKSRRTIALPAEVAADIEPLLAGKTGSDLVFTAPRGGMIVHRTFWSKNWRPAIWRAQHCPAHSPSDCRCGSGEPQRCKLHKTPPTPCGCAGTLTQAPRIHDLRHTHASWLLAMGVPIHVVQARLGHESIQTTVDTYSHLLPDAQAMAANAASMAFTVRTQIA